MLVPRVWAVVPCMGRLAFLKQTAARALHPAVGYCLVDYSCPDRCSDWISAELPDQVSGGQLVVERVSGQTLFNKSAANNLGARRAVREQAEYLCFLDADTLVGAGFWEWVLRYLAPDRFLIAARLGDGRDRPSLTGLLVVPAEAFTASGGFDESFRGWGGEDIEFRLRLGLIHGLTPADIPVELVEAIPHDGELRTRFYEQKNAALSNYCNLRRLKYRVWHAWRASWKVHPDTLERLWYRP